MRIMLPKSMIIAVCNSVLKECSYYNECGDGAS